MNNNLRELLKCEHLCFDARSQQQINDFHVKHPDAINLEHFLKKFAFSEEINNKNRTYLVKDRNTEEIACYFSLRNGLFTLPNNLQSFSTVPAVELSNFAVNDRYKKKYSVIRKIGTLVFNEFIIPIVKDIQKQSGVQALYIYALPNDKLIEHYAALGFMRFSPEEEAFIHNHVKPLYDKGCVFMCQGV